MGFSLKCFQRLSTSYIATQRFLLVQELVHHRCDPSGPLVQCRAPLNALTPIPDMDRTVSRRSEPSSRTALMDEQSNPWDRLQPQVAMSRHRGAKPLRRYELLEVISLLSWSNFYSLSDGPSTRYRRITKASFHSCSTCWSCSQAPLYFYTLQLISVQPEEAFAHLRYFLGGIRPKQTVRLKLLTILIQGFVLGS